MRKSTRILKKVNFFFFINLSWSEFLGYEKSNPGQNPMSFFESSKFKIKGLLTDLKNLKLIDLVSLDISLYDKYTGGG